MSRSTRATWLVLFLGLVTADPSLAQNARISEETRVIETYPFTEPNPVPLLTRDPRLYPYHSFLGYSAEASPREWKVVRLENDYIEVFVLPEVGGKVWGAVVKKTGHEFIYRNEVMKFRNISLRGPWTSGGIEFNFGVIGHTPATATPVDYVLRENADGSVSCFVGSMDLPSRTHWRVEIRLRPDRAYFETNALWYNPTPLEQPYYNWMTAAAFAREDLVMSIPGNAFLEHSGAERAWPIDAEGRRLSVYANNAFSGNKSYHVVGELNDFFGGYYRDDDYGFGHWSRYEEMPGQKLWLWALSRQGGIWEDLLTDDDGQYVEFQAGRLLVQYQPGADVNPITQDGFDPGGADRWSETWFPVEGIGGLTDASRDGAMHVVREGNRLTVAVNAFLRTTDTIRVWSGDRPVASIPVELDVLEPVERSIDLALGARYRVTMAGLGLDYSSDPAERGLRRPFSTPVDARDQIPTVDRLVFEARELVQGRRLGEARALFEAALAEEPWNRDALLGLADLEYRRARFDTGLEHADRALQLDAYDAKANFIAGNLLSALGLRTDAVEAYGWSARSTGFRSVSYVRLAELHLSDGDVTEAERYARLAIDYDAYSLPARQVLAMIARQRAEPEVAAEVLRTALEIDPLHHFARSERYLDDPTPRKEDRFFDGLQGEYPEQIALELAIDYLRRGATDDARAIVEAAARRSGHPLLQAWLGWMDGEPGAVPERVDLAFVFPYRSETLPVLEWVTENDDGPEWRYLLALNLWALDRPAEAGAVLESLGDDLRYAPAYVTRGLLLERIDKTSPEPDLRRAVDLDPGTRVLHIHLLRFLQERERWGEALQASDRARIRFPGDFDLDLLHARALNHLDRPLEAIEILETTHVLPSENAGESHVLFAQAHTLAALDAVDAGAWAEARGHLVRALAWPEHLGQGRPYEPEERLIHYVLGRVERRLGDEPAARAAFESASGATGRGAQSDDPGALEAFWTEVVEGVEPAVAAARLARRSPNIFNGLSGRILRRAMGI